MFDLDFSKLALISVVALVVLGPERLPRVARTAGALLGRAQRYLNDVKAEVTREIEIDELRKMKTGVETAAANLHNTIHQTVQTQTAELTDAWNNGALMTPRDTAAALDESPAAPVSAAALARPAAAPRRNWRSKRSAVPAWYKQASQKRQTVVSHAARVALAARQTPAASGSAADSVADSGRRPIRFL
jgi:sec-independent protein translocase protein TatB